LGGRGNQVQIAQVLLIFFKKPAKVPIIGGKKRKKVAIFRK
jgi:hypothetical protein